MANSITTLTNAIAGLAVAGVTIYDSDQIPPDGLRLTPALIPEPAGFVRNMRFERASFGAAAARRNWNYELLYTYLHCPLGSGRTGLDEYANCLDNIDAILDAVADIVTIAGAVDVIPSIEVVGPISDPAGNMYLGCQIVLSVLQFDD